jgi:ubiquinol-cytochrome c reductase cytochrome c subunit
VVTSCARIAIAVPLAVLMLLAAGGRARGADAQHPLTPSHRLTDGDTIYESGVPPQAAAAAKNADRAGLVRDGASLYGVHCASCHGTDLGGSNGAPSLLAAGGSSVDFYVSTGRMPSAVRSSSDGAAHEGAATIAAAGVQNYHIAPQFDERQMSAIVAYVDSRARQTIPIPAVRIDGATLQRGRTVFESNCQQCHGAAGEGATAGEQWTALPLYRATPTQIGEAIRVGPGVMPRFSSAQLSAGDIDAIATYVSYLQTAKQDYGGTVLDYLGPAGEGGIGAIFGLGMLFWVIYFTGTKADGRRFNERD